MAIYTPGNPYTMPGMNIPPGFPGGGFQTGLPAGPAPGAVPTGASDPTAALPPGKGGGGGGFFDSVRGFLGEGENLAGLAQLIGASANVYGTHQQSQEAERLREEQREQRERRQQRHESLAPFYMALMRQAGGGGG